MCEIFSVIFFKYRVIRENGIEIKNVLINFENILSDYLVSGVPADGLAPVGARTSAGPVIIKWWSSSSHVYTWDLHLEG